MLACSAASEDGLSSNGQKTWGGSHGVPLISSNHIRLNKHFSDSARVGSGLENCPTVCSLYAHTSYRIEQCQQRFYKAGIVGHNSLFENTEM